MLKANLILSLRDVVGRSQVLVTSRGTRRYWQGYRTEPGHGSTRSGMLAVVRPGTLVELWRVLRVLVAQEVAIIVQAANTGLTGGSTPDDRIDRPVVIINTMRLQGIHLVAGGTQVICLPGATLHRLEKVVRAVGREPHSVIGSSCFGASVIGGVCNSSGGALVRRGPAYTEAALFARIEADGTLRLVNRLGVDLGDDPETMLARLEQGDLVEGTEILPASDPDYHDHVRAIDEATPARFNADPRRLHDASGSAGRLVVFAVRLDTFFREEAGATFYLGTNDPGELTDLRRRLLSAGQDLPVSAEYLHRDAFDIADRYGRDTFIAIRLLGTDRLPLLFALKARVDGFGAAIGLADLSERILQRIGRLLPDHLPARLRQWRARFEHHLILTIGADSLAPTRDMLAEMLPSASGDLFECTADEASRASLHRFVTAGAAVRYRAVHRKTTSGIVALDVALPRNAADWFAALPETLDDEVVAVLRYGHFLCHVFHRDYIIRRSAEASAIKAELVRRLDEEGAEYPAEHNVGRQYRAKPALAAFYKALDPTNRLNPGIGMTPTGPSWGEQTMKQEESHD
ncbi:D-lactate dehydrogenase [Sphingomonas bacterium]|uniref:D-lactate dehydrogenase n=1 Tax=Sphingomonas bacterium TaxID=1895847 RepID=UPI001575A7BC|nr:D-lactate dehydrogenase [Sphingomonas bacterium]